MDFPVLQHTFKYIGANQLSLQHEFIYMFEAFIFKNKNYIFLNEMEQNKLSKEYTEIILNHLNEDFNKNTSLNNRHLKSNIQKYIQKANKKKYIDKLDKNIFDIKSKKLLKNIKVISKKTKIYFLENDNNLKDIYVKDLNLKIILSNQFNIIFKNTNKLMLSSVYKNILENKKYNSLLNDRVIKIVKAYKYKLIYIYIRKIINDTNNEKELINFINKEIIKENKHTKIINKFINGIFTDKVKFSKKMLENSIVKKLEKINIEKVLEIYNINNLYKKIKKIICLRNEIRDINLNIINSKFILLNNKNITFKNNKIKNLERWHKHIFSNKHNYVNLSCSFRKLYSYKIKYKELNLNYKNIFNVNNKKYINSQYRYISDKSNKKYVNNYYRKIYKNNKKVLCILVNKKLNKIINEKILQNEVKDLITNKFSFKLMKIHNKEINLNKNNVVLYSNYKTIMKMPTYLYYLNGFQININKYKEIQKLMNKSYINAFKNNNKTVYAKRWYKYIKNNKYNRKLVQNYYIDIFKNYDKNKFVFDFYYDITKKYNTLFLKKEVKYTKFYSNLKYKMLKKDVKSYILKIKLKEKYTKRFQINIYKELLKTKYIWIYNKNINKEKLITKYIIKQDIRNINKYNLKLYYINKYGGDIRKFKHQIIYLNKNYSDIHKNLMKNKYLLKDSSLIYLRKNKYKNLEKISTNIYKIKTKSKYIHIQRKWWILGHDDDLTDKLIIPNIDYPYETNPVIGVNKHPISSYENINYNDINYGTKEIEVSIKIMQQMLNYLFVIWNCALIDWFNLDEKDAMPKIMDIFYFWINLGNVKEEMIQKGSREDYLRVYRWFRWEAEKVWFKTKDISWDTKNNGIKSVGILLSNIIEYMKNHHYNIVPLTSSYHLTIMGNILITFTWQLPDYFRPIDKAKGKRKYFISNKSVNKIKKKLFYKK